MNTDETRIEDMLFLSVFHPCSSVAHSFPFVTTHHSLPFPLRHHSPLTTFPTAGSKSRNLQAPPPNPWEAPPREPGLPASFASQTPCRSPSRSAVSFPANPGWTGSI